MPTVDVLQEQISREERVVGIRPGAATSPEVIRRRRRQIEGVALLVFFGLVLTTLRAQIWGGRTHEFIDPDWLRAAMITCAGGFLAYVVEKEKHLRKLTVLDLEARRTNLDIADAILRSAALSDDVEYLHGSLVLHEVVARIANVAQRRLDAAESAVRLLVAGGELPVVASRIGPSGPVSAAGRTHLAEQVALARLPRAYEAQAGEANIIAAPLVHFGRLLGIVEAVSAPGRGFDNVDLAVLTALAERAAVALGHARTYAEMLERADGGL
jgi:GAF domain-containing protein